MFTYIVTYEVNDTARRAAVENYLRDTGFQCAIHEYAWAIRTAKKAVEIRDDLMKLTIPGDVIFVIRSGTEAAWSTSYSPQHADWLKKYL